MGHSKKMNTDTNELKHLFIIGAPRAGTTVISSTLNQNKFYNASNPNETMYFLNDNLSKDFYVKTYFKNRNGIKIDSSPQYFLHPNLIHKNIQKFYTEKESKFIIVLRNPYDRLISHYNYFKNLDIENKSLDEALEDEMSKIYINNKINYPKKPNTVNGYILNSLYYQPVKSWKKILDKNQLLILNFSDLNDDFNKYMNSINDFCELDPYQYEKYFVNSSNSANFIQKIFFGNNLLKNVLKPLIPQRWRMKIKEKIKLSNSSKNLNNKKYDYKKNDIPEYIIKVISKDLEKLKSITNFNLE